MTESNALDRFFKAGVVAELHEVATRIAPHEKLLVEVLPPQDAAEASDLDFTAISLAKDADTNSHERRVEAAAWMAFFLDRVTQGKCPPDSQLLLRINKKP